MQFGALMTSQRFVRGEPRAEIVRICGRNEVNPALSFDDAAVDERFRRLLEQRFGAGDAAEDAAFVYPIRDVETGACFEAYVADQGPSYGSVGAEVYEDIDADNLQLKPEVIRSLNEFERWLEGA